MTKTERISKYSVDYHRTNIRRKLKLKPEESLRQALTVYFMESGFIDQGLKIKLLLDRGA